MGPDHNGLWSVDPGTTNGRVLAALERGYAVDASGRHHGPEETFTVRLRSCFTDMSAYPPCAAMLDDLLRRYAVRVPTDNAFQARARLLQALWREEKGFPMGAKPNGEPLGSRLPLSFAKETSANFVTNIIRAVVQRELAAKRSGSRQVIEEGRLYANLLSSQPLCFNLFGELQADLELATRVARDLWPERVARITAVRFEHSPGRGDERYTGDHSAFDVFLEHTLPAGGSGFIGIEVKYHESLNVKAAGHKPRYDEVTKAMGCFHLERIAALRMAPLEQLWRDHMLAGAMLATESWASGLYAFLYPEQNTHCHTAIEAYRACLSAGDTFDAVTLERFVECLGAHSTADWVAELRDRYLGWAKIERLLAACGGVP